MDNLLIMLPSVTVAMRAKKILEERKIAVSVKKTPKNLQKQSCGYSVAVFSDRDFSAAVNILKEKNVSILGTAKVY